MQKVFSIQSAYTHNYSWKLFRSTTYILEKARFFLFVPWILPHCNFRVWSFFIYGTLCSWLGPRWWEPRRSMSWSGISASLTRKLILFGVLKACTHTSLAFSYLVTSHELRRRETLNANSQTSWVFRKVPDPSWKLTHFVTGVSFLDKRWLHTQMIKTFISKKGNSNLKLFHLLYLEMI